MKTSDISLIEASEIDSEQLANISKRAFETDAEYGLPKNIQGPPGYDSPSFYTKILRFMNSFCIMFNDEIVGGIMVNIKDKHGVIERIFVDPNHMRKGIGSVAIRQVLEKYPEVVLWNLGTPEWNLRTQPFYEKLGFNQIGWEHSEEKFRGRWYEKRIGTESILTPIGTLKDGMRNLLIEGEIVEKSQPRMVRSKRTREALTVSNAGLTDNTGRVVLVLWGDQIKLLKIGGKIRVEEGYTTSYNGILQLNIGYGRLITLN
ncbi:GNAT family N-acetyltransferase [Candidatus Bathyarchaeota archaeon]|nr:GNAT family N-acetyltransferase [Candidatus Bathyarchaeota archaeon]